MNRIPHRIVIASSSTLMRRGAAAMVLEHYPTAHVLEAGNDADLVQCCSEKAPELLVVDPCSREFSLVALQAIRKSAPEVRTVVISDGLSGLPLLDAVRSGIEVFLRSDCDAHEIGEALVACQRGVGFFCGQILAALEDAGVDVDALKLGAWTCEPVWLTEREREVLTLIAEGLTHTQIADKLSVSGHTVIAHRKNIQQKLGARNTASLVLSAVKLGLTAPNRFLFKA
jgi:DNA-binding NarL/FixJ family response regulator